MKVARTLCVLGAVVLAGCPDAGTGGGGAELPDIQEVTSLDAIQPNGCGGITPLLVDGEPARPGDPCGECHGVVTCAGADSAVCSGAAEANACGGCEPLGAKIGATCGHCGGAWECGADGGLACSDARPANVCGGCEDLGDASPGAICELDGQPGVTRCVTLDAIACVPLAANGCGGTAELPAAPGTFCGPCSRGVNVCDGVDAILCQGADKGLNACDGCGVLAGEPGEACGGCGGTWACAEGAPGVVCEAAPFNACGGCAALDGAPGEACDGGVWACSGAEAVACVPAGGNLCGGQGVLAQQPGAACGPCADGVVVCATAESTTCVGASALNACGGCGPLPGVAGQPCAPNGAWVCFDEELVCEYDPQANPCGGSAALGNQPGDPCGTCDAGAYACNGFEAVKCSGGAPGPFYAWPDVDGDGFGDRDAEPEVQCELQGGFVRDDGDCDDSEETGAAVYPGADEVCDGIDNDCDDVVDPGSALGASIFYADKDGDGVGAQAKAVSACVLPAGHVAEAGDCDDNDAAVYPGASGESCDDPKDYDCDGQTSYVDADGDGSPSCGGTVDCDDDDAAVRPGAAELCDGVDNDCDGQTDEASASDVSTFFADTDGDGYGDPDATVEACAAPAGYVADSGDCDDTAAAAHPGAGEVCDGIDNDCNGQTDIDTPIALKPTWHQDLDGDGFGSAGDTATTCDPPDGYVPASSIFADDDVDRFDCVPTDPTIHPNADGAPVVLERCDFIDNDCDGHVDMGGWTPGAGWPAWPGPPAAPGFAWIADRDGDAFGNPAEPIVGCHPALASAAPTHGDLGFQYLPAGGEADCNDLNPLVHPGAFEVPGDGVDQSCDGLEVCFVDADGDGAVGDFSLTQAIVGLDCAGQPNVAGADAPADCDDTDAAVRPGVAEIVGDEKDQNCDGVEFCFRDDDQDGFRTSTNTAWILSDDLDCADRELGEAAASQPQVDCDDTNPGVNPLADDRPWDVGDVNCDGIEGTAWRSRFAAVGGSTDADCGKQNKPCATAQAAVDAVLACPDTDADFIAACQAMCHAMDAQCASDCVARGSDGSMCDLLLVGGTFQMADTLVLPAGIEVFGSMASPYSSSYVETILALAPGSPATTTVDVPGPGPKTWIKRLTAQGPTLGTMRPDAARAPDSVALRTGPGLDLALRQVTVVAGKGADAEPSGPRLVPPGTCPGTCGGAPLLGGRANYDLLEAPYWPARGQNGFGRGGAGGGNAVGILSGGGKLELYADDAVILGTGGAAAAGIAGHCANDALACGAGGGGAGGSTVGIALAKGSSRPNLYGFDYRTIVDASAASVGAGGSGVCAGGVCSGDGEAGLILPMFRSTTLARDHGGVAFRGEFIVSPSPDPIPSQAVAEDTCEAAGAVLGSNIWPDSPSFLEHGLNDHDYWIDYVIPPDKTQPTVQITQNMSPPYFWDFQEGPHDEDCVALYQGKLTDEECMSWRPFLCERPVQPCDTSADCGSWTCVERLGARSCAPPTPSGVVAGQTWIFQSIYQAFTTGVLWAEAATKCQEWGGGKLVELETYTELTNLLDVPYPPHWVGLSDQTQEGVYRWQDGSLLDMTELAPAVAFDSADVPACGRIVGPPPPGQSRATLDLRAVNYQPSTHAICREPYVDCPYGYRGWTCSECSEGFAKDPSGVCRATCANSPCVAGTCTDCLTRGDCDTDPDLTCDCAPGRAGPYCERCEAGHQDRDADGECAVACDGTGICGPNPTACDETSGKVICVNGCPAGQQDHDRDGVCECAEGRAGAACDTCAPGYNLHTSGCHVSVGTEPAIALRLNEVGGEIASDDGWLSGNAQLLGFCCTSHPDADPLSGWTADGVLGEGALRFDGVDDQIYYPKTLFTYGTTELWARPTVTTGSNQVLLRRGDGFFIGIAPDGRAFTTWSDATAYGPVVQAGEWVHLAVQFAGMTLTLFVDGQPVASATSVNGAISNDQLWIGADYGDKDHFTGTIDQVRVWDAVLSDAEIQSFYDAGVAALAGQ